MENEEKSGWATFFDYVFRIGAIVFFYFVFKLINKSSGMDAVIMYGLSIIIVFILDIKSYIRNNLNK